MKSFFAQIKPALEYARHEHASSVVMGIAFVLYAVATYFGVARDIGTTFALGIALIFVALFNHVSETRDVDGG